MSPRCVATSGRAVATTPIPVCWVVAPSVESIFIYGKKGYLNFTYQKEKEERREKEEGEKDD